MWSASDHAGRHPRAQLLRALVALGLDKVLAQATAIVLVTPLNFVGNKLWSFRLRPLHRDR
jgi:putative flippase GtrA